MPTVFGRHCKRILVHCNFTLVLCAKCVVYWLTTSPRQLRAASLHPGWTNAMRCWVAHRRRLSTNYSTPKTTWSESYARAGIAPMPGRCFAHYIGFQWGSMKWLYWLRRCRPQPLQRISVSWYKLTNHLGLCAHPMLRCWSFLAHTHRTGPLRFLCCCSIHLELSTCWHSTVWKHSHFQTPLENRSVQIHLVLLCCHKHLCIFRHEGAIKMRYY